MKVSRNWLQTYFEKEIPSAEKLAELFTFHSFEVEGIEEIAARSDLAAEIPADSILDLKILPDRAHYDLSHNGIAEEIAVLTKLPIKNRFVSELKSTIQTKPTIKVDEPIFCRRYVARIVEFGGSNPVAESPIWLKTALEAIGQRSINSIVDITNYVMYDIGQPLHAFDADKVKGAITVRAAKEGEKITLLDGREITLTSADNVIADEEGPLVIAGAKGGKRAEISQSTKRIMIEAANFDPTMVRRTSTKYDIRSDSSKRFENEITAELAMNGMNNVCALIQEMIPEAKFGPIFDEYLVKDERSKIVFDPAYISKRLGVDVLLDEAKAILERMGVAVKEVATEAQVSHSANVGGLPLSGGGGTPRRVGSSSGSEDEQVLASDSELAGNVGLKTEGGPRGAGAVPNHRNEATISSASSTSENNSTWTLTIPYDRLDLVIKEDVVEEVGRVYGYDKITGKLPEVNRTVSASTLPLFYFIEKVKNILIDLGFSEVSLYTLVEKGEVETAKPLAKDKAFARSNLYDGMKACLERNALNADLLGLEAVKVFEFGHVFTEKSEEVHLSLGVTQVKKVKGLKAESIIAEAVKTIEKEMDVTLSGKTENAKIGNSAIFEIDLGEAVKTFKSMISFDGLEIKPASTNRYQRFSMFPFIVRDVAVFVPDLSSGEIGSDKVWSVIETGLASANLGNKETAAELLARHSLFDTFKKDGKTSYAFRMIFQSMERTLTDDEANKIMETIYAELKREGWEVR